MAGRSELSAETREALIKMWGLWAKEAVAKRHAEAEEDE